MISAVVLTHNSERTLERVLGRLSWCSEILVIDDCSMDNSLGIAKKYGARVFVRRLNSDFSAQRNFGLTKAKHEWVLFVDSDEVVSRELCLEIKKAIKASGNVGFYVKRKDFWMGKWLQGGESGGVWLLRLGRRRAGKWRRRVHETWEIEGRVGKLGNVLLHYPHPGVGSFIKYVNFHSYLHALENEKEKKRVGTVKVIFYPIGKFVYNFWLRRGFRDGTHGFVAAVIMSLHSFLAWGKYYQDKR